jgi:hypothetical protein
MITWKPMRTAPRRGVVKLLGTTDSSSDEYRQIEGVWDDEMELYVTKTGWCIVAVAWRESE